MIKRMLLWTIILAQVVTISAQNRAMEIRKNLLDKNTQKVTVVSHRGDWRGFPENSIAGLESAIRMGVDVVELDVQKTKDGKLILMHDNTLDRCTTGKGKIENWTLDSIKTLKLKNGCACRTKHAVPTLEEALIVAKGKVMLNLDKADRYFDDIYPLLVKTNMTKQIIMKGGMSAETVKERFGKYLDEVLYMPIVNLDKPGAEEQINQFVTQLNVPAFELLYVKDSNPLPKKMEKELKGKALIWYNTLWDTMAGAHDDDMSLEDPNKGYGYLIKTLGARILQTDQPQYLINYLKSKKLHK